MNVQVLQAYSCKILDTLVKLFLLGIESTLSGLRKPNRAMLDLMLPGIKGALNPHAHISSHFTNKRQFKLFLLQLLQTVPLCNEVL